MQIISSLLRAEVGPQTPSQIKFGETTYLDIPSEYEAQSCEDVLHSFIKGLECEYFQRVNTAIYEAPLHAVVSFKRNNFGGENFGSGSRPTILTFTVNVLAKPRGGFLLGYTVETPQRAFAEYVSIAWSGLRSKFRQNGSVGRYV